MDPASEDEGGVDRLRVLAERVVGRVGGLPAVKTLASVLEVYDGAGGGLVAGGLAYASLIALLPGLLLMLSIFGVIIDDAATREQIVGVIAKAVPPLEEMARTAFEQVSAKAVPTGVIAFVGLLWGASRFYSSLDYAFTRIFHNARRRNEIERTLRGVLVTGLVVALPLAALLAGSMANWLLDLAPDAVARQGIARGLFQLASPVGSFLLFVTGTALVFRFVPGNRVPVRAWRRPAILVGIVLASFAQAFTFIAPRLTHTAAIYGTFVAFFAILAWLSISFNVLLFGAAWTRVRELALLGEVVAPGDTGDPPATPADATELGPI
jgi:membrane protein